MSTSGLEQARLKMQAAGVNPHAIEAFANRYQQLETGNTGFISESEAEPVEDVPHVDELNDEPQDSLARVAVIKLNGGLGTSMGLDRAKSLINVRAGNSFLDIIVQQVRYQRQKYAVDLPLLFMNSFRTEQDTRSALAAYADLDAGFGIDFLQSQEPKLLADDLTPVTWEKDPALEWCPPGHGDVFVSLDSSGLLDRLLDAGYEIAFFSNSDNLGATPDEAIAAWFAQSGAPLCMEVALRTEADVKGGHLVRIAGNLVLREVAQIGPDDLAAAGDISKHRFFNTNNIWVNLPALRAKLDEGVLNLPVIVNRKTVDPTDKNSPAVIQLETAMGAALNILPGSVALEVTRQRFRPVKTTSDLLVLRSDVFELADDSSLVQNSVAPIVELDERYYQSLADFERRLGQVPSLREADRVRIDGDWTFGPGVVLAGDVHLTDDGTPQQLPAGTRLSG